MRGKLGYFLAACCFLSFSNSSIASEVSGSIVQTIKALSGKCKDYECYYLQQNIFRDTTLCQAPQEIAFSDPQLRSPKKITGRIFYESVWPGRYSYNVIPNVRGGYDIVIKVHFKNKNQFDFETLNEMKRKIYLASDYWSQNSPIKIYGFKFDIVNEAKDADFSVNLLKVSRGPYYSKWSTDWGPRDIAHEMGHMLGLDDEYGTLYVHGHCNSNSIMCDESAGLPRNYHYYQIYKRIHCK